jgi:hypothetical protein
MSPDDLARGVERAVDVAERPYLEIWECGNVEIS